MTTSEPWFFWAVLSAVFAALTAIFAKIGIQGIDSDLATPVRTAIIIVVLSLFVWLTGKWSNPFALPGRTWLFLGLSGLATGAPGSATSGPCKLAMPRKSPGRQVQPGAGRPVRRRLFR